MKKACPNCGDDYLYTPGRPKCGVCSEIELQRAMGMLEDDFGPITDDEAKAWLRRRENLRRRLKHGPAQARAARFLMFAMLHEPVVKRCGLDRFVGPDDPTQIGEFLRPPH